MYKKVGHKLNQAGFWVPAPQKTWMKMQKSAAWPYSWNTVATWRPLRELTKQVLGTPAPSGDREKLIVTLEISDAVVKTDCQARNRNRGGGGRGRGKICEFLTVLNKPKIEERKMEREKKKKKKIIIIIIKIIIESCSSMQICQCNFCQIIFFFFFHFILFFGTHQIYNTPNKTYFLLCFPTVKVNQSKSSWFVIVSQMKTTSCRSVPASKIIHWQSMVWNGLFLLLWTATNMRAKQKQKSSEFQTNILSSQKKCEQPVCYHNYKIYVLETAPERFKGGQNLFASEFFDFLSFTKEQIALAWSILVYLFCPTLKILLTPIFRDQRHNR